MRLIPNVSRTLMSSMMDTPILIGISLLVMTVMSRAYIWMVAKSHGQTMDEYMQALADRVKKQSRKDH